MVISVFAAGIAFSGSAAAQEHNSSATITLDEGDTISISGDTLESEGAINDQTDVSESKEIFDSLNGDVDQGLVVNVNSTSDGDIPAGINSDFNPQIRYAFTEPVTASNGDGSEIVAAVIYYSGSGESGVNDDYGSFQSDTNWQAVFITDDGGATNSVGNAETTTGNLGKIIEISVQRFVDEYESAEVESLSVNLLNQDDDDETIEHVAVGDQTIPLDQVGEDETSVKIGGDYYTSIQSAVDDAEPFDTIEVGPGTYNETVSINTDDITLKGPNAGIDGASDNRGQEANITKTVAISSNNVTVDGFTISNKEGNFDVDNLKTAVKVGRDNNRNDGNEIRNNVIRDAKYGLLENKARGLTIEDNLFTTSIDTAGIATFYTTADLEIIDNTFDTGDIDVSLGDTSGDVEATVSENEFYGGGEFGITVVGYAEANITDNDFVNTNKAIRVPSDAEEYVVNAHRNDLSGAEIGVYNKGPKPVNATNNWWGSANGPNVSENTYNNDSQGADISGDDVEFTPWLNASPDNGGQSFVPVTNDSGGQFASIQAAVDTASSDEVVDVSAGTYNEAVEIGTQNVTLVGPNANTSADADDREPEAIIEGSITVASDNVGVAGFTIESNETQTPAVLLANYGSGLDTAVIANNTIRADGDASNGVQIPQAGPTEQVVIIGNDIRSDDAASVNVFSGAVHERVIIEDNVLRSDPAGLRDIGELIFVNNTVEDTADGNVDLQNISQGVIAENDFRTYDSGAISANVFDDPDAETRINVTITRNNFLDDDGVDIDAESADDASTISAPLNWYGENGTPDVSGDLVYEPLLTVPAEEAADEPQNIRNYGSYIEVETEGEPTVIGFPAPPAEPLSELLSNDTLEREDGEAVTFFIYDNANDSFEMITDLDSTTPQAGEVLVITTENQSSVSEEIIVPIETDTDAPIGAPTEGEVQLDTGWNLVATGAANSADDPIVAGTEVLAGTQLGVTQPSQPGAPSADVGAYHGTWILMDDEGILFTGYAPDTPPLLYADLTLNPDTDNSEAQE
jgi:hypothetical protein